METTDEVKLIDIDSFAIRTVDYIIYYTFAVLTSSTNSCTEVLQLQLIQKQFIATLFSIYVIKWKQFQLQTGAASEDVGIEINRGDDTNQKFGWEKHRKLVYVWWTIINVSNISI